MFNPYFSMESSKYNVISAAVSIGKDGQRKLLELDIEELYGYRGQNH